MKQLIHLQQRIAKTSSSILVPERLMKKMQKYLYKFGSLRNFLRHTTISRHWLFAAQARKDTGKILYQDKGQKLIRFDFRPFEDDWERFRLLAMNRRISMAMLFSILLAYFDDEGGGVPTTPQKILLLQSLIPYQGHTYIRLHRLII